MKTVEQIRRENLTSIIDEAGGMSALAKKLERSYAQINQWKNASVDSKTGKQRNVGSTTARRIEEIFNKQSGWMDIDHTAQLRAFVSENQQVFYVDSVEIPLMNAYGSAGHGNDMPTDDLVIDILRTSRTWLEKTFKPELKNLETLRYIHAIGDSMMPTFNNGDVLLVDTSAREVKADRIFVLEAHSRLFIKRVRQRLDGSFEISSDNPAVKTVDILNGDTQVSVLGQVIWVWNGKRL